MYGTLGVLDTLKSQRQSIAQFGEDQAFEAIQIALDAHNAQFDAMVADFIERTTDRQRAYGSAASMTMDELDEFGRPDAQKITAGVTVGFPLRLFGEAVQWNRKFMQNATTIELAAQFEAAQDAHIRALQREIKRALFNSANRTFADALVDNVVIAVKALLNADGAGIPNGPNGETFDGTTHTHYLARVGGAVAESDVAALITTVIEHNNMGGAMVYISQSLEASFRAFADFVPYIDARVIPGSGVTVGAAPLAPINVYNRAIGLLNGAEVWVKPWMPVGYMFAFVKGAAKPLVLRERNPGGANLVMVADEGAHPLHARLFEAEFGVGVWERTNGAVLDTTSTTYTIPTIA